MVDKAFDNGSDQASSDGAAGRIFAVRGGRKLVAYIVYHRKSGLRPQALRIQIGQKKSTSITLKNKDFFLQYQKAIDLVADYHSIPESSEIRTQMAATAQDFLAAYGLETRTIEARHGKATRIVRNAAIEVGEDGHPQPAAQNEQTHAQVRAPDGHRQRHLGTFLVNGRVRGVTFKPRCGDKPAHIYVRPWRAKTASFSLENTSFSAQYARAIAVMVRSLALEPDDPIRISMERSGPVFLKFYNLTTQPVSIPDVAVLADASDQPPT